MQILSKGIVPALLLCIVCTLETRAQSLHIENPVELVAKNIYASRNSRTDSKGQYCGVVMIHSSIPELEFSGKIVGDIRYEAGVYYVYMIRNASKLEVKSKTGSKLTIKLPSIESKSTYEVTLYEDNGRGYVACQSDPSGAKVTLISQESRLDLGNTPLRGNVEILEGVYDFEMTKPGYQSKTLKGIKISPNKTTKLGTIKLKKM